MLFHDVYIAIVKKDKPRRLRNDHLKKSLVEWLTP